jgi:hypothetical protein
MPCQLQSCRTRSLRLDLPICLALTRLLPSICKSSEWLPAVSWVRNQWISILCHSFILTRDLILETCSPITSLGCCILRLPRYRAASVGQHFHMQLCYRYHPPIPSLQLSTSKNRQPSTVSQSTSTLLQELLRAMDHISSQEVEGKL